MSNKSTKKKDSLTTRICEGLKEVRKIMLGGFEIQIIKLLPNA